VREAEYWVRQMREGVRFSAGVEEIRKQGVGVWLEVGPGRSLGTLVRQHPQEEGVPRTIISSLRHGDEEISDEEKMLAGLGQLWAAGVEVQWEKMYEGERRWRVPLPTYPFERQRYWVAPRLLEETLRHQPGELRKNPDIAEWFYVPVWKQSVVTARHQPLNGDGSRITRRSRQQLFCLLFGDDLGIGAQVAEQLRQQGNEVVAVTAGEQFQRLSGDRYVINARQRRDYDSLIEEVLKSGQTPQLIAHMWGVTEPENQSLSERQQPSAQAILEHSQQRGFYSLLFLSQALAQAGVSDEVHLCVITSNVQAVTGTETLIPEKATVLGPCRVIPQEYANVVCRSVDIEIASTGMPQPQLIAQLVNELSTPTSEERVIAYRGRHRWVQTFEPLRIENENEGSGLTGEDSSTGGGVIEHKPIQGQLPSRLRERGVYFLTGGTGSIALEIARYLAKTVRARLVLVGRKALPERGQWEKWVVEHAAEDDVSRKIERLRELEESGAELLLVQADVSNEAELREALRVGVERFGEINGVIHTAGLVGANAVSDLAETGYVESERQFQAKIFGLLTLARVFRESSLDFCLLTSSLSSILGGLGFAAYAAANNFMDAFAHQHNQSSPVPWISVNWDGWQFDSENREGGFSSTTSALAITGEEGVDAFQRILHTDGLTQVAVSTGDLQARIARWVKLESIQEKDGNKESAASTLHSRPDLPNEYHAPENETEQIIADIWQTLLGIEQVGIHDNFFELGGHSLLATQLISRVRGVFHVEFSLRSFFESPTVKSLAQIVAESAELEEAKKLEVLLREVEDLTDEEIESTLSGDTQ
jgi:acyl transferase domain-containing protein